VTRREKIKQGVTFH